MWNSSGYGEFGHYGQHRRNRDHEVEEETVIERVVYDWNHQGRCATKMVIRKKIPAPPPPIISAERDFTSSHSYKEWTKNSQEERSVLDYNHTELPKAIKDEVDIKFTAVRTKSESPEIENRKRKRSEKSPFPNPLYRGSSTPDENLTSGDEGIANKEARVSPPNKMFKVEYDDGETNRVEARQSISTLTGNVKSELDDIKVVPRVVNCCIAQSNDNIKLGKSKVTDDLSNNSDEECVIIKEVCGTPSKQRQFEKDDFANMAQEVHKESPSNELIVPNPLHNVTPSQPLTDSRFEKAENDNNQVETFKEHITTQEVCFANRTLTLVPNPIHNVLQSQPTTDSKYAGDPGNFTNNPVERLEPFASSREQMPIQMQMSNNKGCSKDEEGDKIPAILNDDSDVNSSLEELEMSFTSDISNLSLADSDIEVLLEDYDDIIFSDQDYVAYLTGKNNGSEQESSLSEEKPKPTLTANTTNPPENPSIANATSDESKVLPLQDPLFNTLDYNTEAEVKSIPTSDENSGLALWMDESGMADLSRNLVSDCCKASFGLFVPSSQFQYPFNAMVPLETAISRESERAAQ